MDTTKPATPVAAPRVAIYCRYSSEQQRGSFSIEAQRRSCEDFAKRSGWTVSKVYVDEARSGSSDRREAFQAMISDAVAKAPPFQIVLVHKSDRFARNREDAVKYKALLKRQGIRFVSATEPIGSGDATEVLLESMLDGMAEFYSLQLSQRTLAGMAEAARQGWALGKAPFGYRHEAHRTAKGPKNSLVIDHSQASVVRKIFALYADGYGITTVRERLAKAGHPFTKNYLLWMLRNPKYSGDTAFAMNAKKHAKAKTHITPILVQNTHPPIIDKATWATVQKRLAARAEASETRFVQSEYLLSGVLRCSCGSAMVGQSAHGNGGRFRYYTCSTKTRRGKASCGLASIAAAPLEEQVYAQIKEHLTDEHNVLSLIQANNEALASLQKTKGSEVAALRAEIGRKEAGARNLMAAVEAGKGLQLEHIAARLEEIAGEKRALEARIAEREAFQLKKPVSGKEAEAFVAYLTDLFKSGLLKNKTLFSGLIQRIELLPSQKKARVLYNPSFHPHAELVELKKKPSSGPLNDNGSHDGSLAPQIGPHANLFPAHFIRLKRITKRRARARTPELAAH